MTGARGAAFLDRDGTVIRDTEYLSRPEDVALLPGAAAAVRRLNDARVPVIVVTNQSGIGRGLLTEADYDRVRTRFEELLARDGARLDATYHCPHAPGPDGRPTCDCRKPGTLLYRRAADEHAVDLTASWYVGDRLRDVLPARTLGGHGILVPTPATSPHEVDEARPFAEVVASLGDAVDRILGG